jgi:hypothetical protein
MILLAIDPGTTHSGIVEIETDTGDLLRADPAVENEKVLVRIAYAPWEIVCERIVGQGKRVGNETFRTAEWYGRFEQRAADVGTPFHPVTRKKVHDWAAKNCPRPLPATADARVRKAMIHMYPAGALKGVTGHAMAALACGVYYLEKRGKP